MRPCVRLPRAGTLARSLLLAGLLLPAAATAQEDPDPRAGESRPPSIGLDYSYTHLDGGADPWHLASLSVGGGTRIGTVIARGNLANRFGISGTQFEIDAYPALTGSTYAYLNAGYADADIFPAWRFGAELYGSLPAAWEVSAGIRELRFEGTNVTLLTGSVGRYVGNYWLSVRPFVRPTDDGTSASASVTARRYFESADEYVGARVGYGSTPTDRLTPQELSRTTSFSAGVHGSNRLREALFGTWTVVYDREELASDSFRNRVEVAVGVRLDL